MRCSAALWNIQLMVPEKYRSITTAVCTDENEARLLSFGMCEGEMCEDKQAA